MTDHYPMYVGDNCCVLGMCRDVPRQDTPGYMLWAYGSPHSAGWNVVFCDGSVRTMSYALEWNVHRHLSNRADGQVIKISDN